MCGSHLELLKMAAFNIKNLIYKTYLKYLRCLTHFWWRGAMTIEDPLLSAYDYQLLPLTTGQ